MEQTDVPVLIVGAGPTGATLGIELGRRGVPCRVVDRLAAPVPTSRSFTLHSIIMAHGTSVEERIALSREPGFTQQAISKISGLFYHYRDAALVGPDRPELDGLTAGDRAPDVRLNTGLRLHDLFRHERHTLLVLTSNAAGEALGQLVGDVTRHFGTRLRVEVLAPADGYPAPPTSAIAVASDESQRRYGAADGDVFCLIRPDGYLAMRGRFTDPQTLLAGLTEYLS